MNTTLVQNRGIYHALPTYPESFKGLTAIITGANGISGFYMLRILAESPMRWSKIYCLSRRPPLVPGGLPPNAEHIALDFLKSPDEIGEVLRSKGVKADYVFFFSYIQVEPKVGGGLWSDAEEMCRVNTLLLTNFLGGLDKAEITPKRFMLQTGAKNYGVHLGPSKLPQYESAPRVNLEPNFYYPQEDTLWAWCAQRRVGWNIVMPGPILGAVPDAAMNAAFPLAVYAAVTAHQRSVLEFPGDIASWQDMISMSSSAMNAYMEEWSVLNERAGDQKFNAWDGGVFTWEGFWPRLAGWYGVEWKGPGDADEGEYIARETRFNPRGYGGKGVSKRRWTFVDWAKKEETKKAWSEIAEQHGLPQKELKDVDRVFGFLDGTAVRAAPLMFSSDKARKLGWNAYVDSAEALLEVFEDLAKLKMIPPVPKVDVKFE